MLQVVIKYGLGVRCSLALHLCHPLRPAAPMRPSPLMITLASRSPWSLRLDTGSDAQNPLWRAALEQQYIHILCENAHSSIQILIYTISFANNLVLQCCFRMGIVTSEWLNCATWLSWNNKITGWLDRQIMEQQNRCMQCSNAWGGGKGTSLPTTEKCNAISRKRQWWTNITDYSSCYGVAINSRWSNSSLHWSTAFLVLRHDNIFYHLCFAAGSRSTFRGSVAQLGSQRSPFCTLGPFQVMCNNYKL